MLYRHKTEQHDGQLLPPPHLSQKRGFFIKERNCDDCKADVRAIPGGFFAQLLTTVPS